MNFVRGFVVVLLGSIFFTAPLAVFAHVNGEATTRINGKDTTFYPIIKGNNSIFDLHAEVDSAPENYLVGEELKIELDLSKLPTHEIIAKTELIWDFGDGGEKEIVVNGYKNSHTYKKMGTYVLTISADYAAAGFPELGIQPISTNVLQIVPDRNYVLPQATIRVNGETHETFTKSGFVFKDTFLTNLVTSVEFDASDSQRGSGKIISYQWDFGDGQAGDKANEKHRYEKTDEVVTVLLRVRDENGFFSDDYATIRHDVKQATAKGKDTEKLFLLAFILGTVLIFLPLGIFNARKSVKRKKT